MRRRPLVARPEGSVHAADAERSTGVADGPRWWDGCTRYLVSRRLVRGLSSGGARGDGTTWLELLTCGHEQQGTASTGPERPRICRSCAEARR